VAPRRGCATGNETDVGAKKQAKKAKQAKRRVALLERIVADAMASAERQVEALDGVLQQSAEDAERAGAVARDAVEAVERHRKAVERAAQTVDATVVDLEGRARQRAASIDRQAEAALAHVDTSGRAAGALVSAHADAALTQLDATAHDAEALLTTETDAALAELTRVTEASRGSVEDAVADALRNLDDHVRAVGVASAASLDEINREMGSPLPDVPGEPVPPEADTSWTQRAEPAPVDEPPPAPISVSFVEEAEAVTSLEDGGLAPSDSPLPSAEAALLAAGAQAFPDTWTELAPTPAVETRPRTTALVTFDVSAAEVDASLKHLARSAADGWVHAELVHGVSDAQAVCVLRLTVFDVSGYWEYHDISGEASAFGRANVTVDIAELSQAIEIERHRDARDMVSITLGDDIAVGSVLVLARTPRVPQLTGERRKIERVDLRNAGVSGLTLDSQIGRFEVPSRLVSVLRSRRAHEADLVTVDDRPCLSARVAGPTRGTAAAIVAPLDDDPEAPAVAGERRTGADSPIGQLLSALSSSSSPEELEFVLASGIGYARRRAAAHPALPPQLIEEMLRDGTEAMRAAAASNPSIPVESIERAATDPAPAVRAAVAANPQMAPTLLLRLAHDQASEVRLRVASNHALPLELLEHLADDPNPAVRATVAADERTSVETLDAMSHDSSPMVCAAVAQNPKCPIEMLDALLAVAPEVVLANPRAPEHLLVAGSKVKSRLMRAAVAANPTTPDRQLQQLAQDPDSEVRAAVAANVAASPRARRRARRQSSRSEQTTPFEAEPTDVAPGFDPVSPLT
jgi:hypothetical protein